LGGDHLDRCQDRLHQADLNEWPKKAERDSGRAPGVTTEMAARLKALERENRELRPCVVGIKACATAHHWTRELMAIRGRES
jgi:transposase-like protein